MAKRLTPNQKAWAREMARIEDMARSLGIKDISSIKPKTPEKITKKHIAQAEAFGMDYVREKAQLDSANISINRQKRKQKSKAIGGTKKPDYIHKPRRPMTEAEREAAKERLGKARQSLTHEQRSQAARKGASKRAKSAKTGGRTRSERYQEVKNLPRASSVMVANFFEAWAQVAHFDNPWYSSHSSYELEPGAGLYFYQAMQHLYKQIGEAGFARLLMLVEQEGKKVYLEVPPSMLTKAWVMEAVTQIYGVAEKNHLSYAKNLREVWENTAEIEDYANMEIEDEWLGFDLDSGNLT